MADKSNANETLFSLELLVEFVRMYKLRKEKRQMKPAIGVRLLDFPTLIVYPKDSNESVSQDDSDSEKENESACDLLLQPQIETSEYSFQRGKSCLFKISIDSLHVHLSNTPLYVMVLDIRNDVPTFVGSALISLAKLTDRIKVDVREYGICTPSAHGERGLFAICNLMGEKIGCISLAYKLLSLGASLMQHIPENRIYKVGSVQDKSKQDGNSTVSNADVRNTNVNSVEEICETLQPKGNSMLLCQKIELEGKQRNIIVSDPKAKPKYTKSASTQTEHKKRKSEDFVHQGNQGIFDSEINFSTFCPPPLYYSCSERKHEAPGSTGYRSLNIEMDVLTAENSSEEESQTDERDKCQKNIKCVSKSETTNNSEAEQTVTAITTLGDALRQLPLLNALLAELSQFYIQHHLLPVHPNLPWLHQAPPHQPCSTSTNQEPALRANAKSSLASRGGPTAKHNRCSVCSAAPLSSSIQKKAGLNKQSSAWQKTPAQPVHKQKLSYGLTTTFLLRLQQTNPKVLKEHDRKKLYKKEGSEQSKSMNVKYPTQIVAKSSQKPNHFENGEIISTTVRQDRNALKSSSAGLPQAEHAQRQLVSKKECASLQVNKTMESNRQLLTSPPRHSVSEENLENTGLSDHKGMWVCTPLRLSQCSDVGDEEEFQSSFSHQRSSSANPGIYSTSFEDGISRVTSQAQRHSDSSSNSAGPADYTDDFTSLEHAEGYSPDFLSSPEPAMSDSRQEVLEDCLSPSSNSQTLQRVALPVPVKAAASPQRPLKGMRVIRPQTEALAVSPLSDDSEHRFSSGRSAWLRHCRQVKTTLLDNEEPSTSRNLRESGNWPSDHSRDSPSCIATKHSESSPEAKMNLTDFEEEMDDDLGSLGFNNKYRHVSELVASKLPGYTL